MCWNFYCFPIANYVYYGFMTYIVQLYLWPPLHLDAQYPFATHLFS